MNMLEIKTLLKIVIEAVMPNLDHYRKPVRKGKVTATYPSDGKYVCDVELLLNNDQPDESEPEIRGVEIPIIWGGPQRGIVCPPAVGTYCDVEYYHGDPDYPRISNFRWNENEAPEAEVDALIIQQTPGIFIHIEAGGNIHIETTEEVNIDAGSNSTINIGGNVNATVKGEMILDVNGGDLTVNVTAGNLKADVSGNADITATTINMNGGVGVITGASVCPLTGSPHMDFSATVNAGK